MPDQPKNPTSQDVARRAQVSRATVSYVLNGRKDKKISPQVRQRVLDAAAQLGYHANRAAVSLISGKSDVIGFVSTDAMETERIWQTVDGIRRRLQMGGRTLMLCSKQTDDTGLPDYVRQYLKGSIDGLIYLVSEMDDNPDFHFLTQYQIPSVVIDAHDPDLSMSTVDVDYYHGAWEVLEYADQMGYRRIHYLTSDIVNPRESQRQQALQDYRETHPQMEMTLHVVPAQVYNNDWPFERVRDDIMDIANRYDYKGHDVTICAVPFHVLISQYVTDRAGIDRTVQGLIALGDRQAFRYAHPGVTASAIPWPDVGAQAVELMEDALNKQPVQHIKVRPQLVVRDSTPKR